MLTSEQINSKLNEIESDMEKLVTENRRLIDARNGVYVELDTCVSLIAKFANKCGYSVGTAPGNIIVIDLPSGQVSWEFGAEEAHLFDTFGPYEKPIEDISAQEKYARVMNAEF